MSEFLCFDSSLIRTILLASKEGRGMYILFSNRLQYKDKLIRGDIGHSTNIKQSYQNNIISLYLGFVNFSGF